MVELGDRARFAFETVAETGIYGKRRADDLDGDRSIQPGVGCLLDLTPAARAE